MKRNLILSLMIFSTVILAQPKFSKMSVMPGAFSRMGFGARGMGMGNAMSAVIEGNLVSYYNPAVIVFQKNNSFQASYSILSLDRSLNFISFTKRFEFFSKKDSALKNPKPRSTAGISLGIINSGVGKIDGRDNEGYKTGNLSTSENQFFLAFATKFSDRFSLGISVKLYYYKLYQKISSTGVGLDIGTLFIINKYWNIAFMISDVNSKYKWDTTPIYNTDGTNSINKFPLLRKLGVSYINKELKLIADVDFENSNAGTNIIRAGVEYNIISGLFLRSGIDQFNLSNFDEPVQPTFGFSYFKQFGDISAGVNYAFIIERYSPEDRHIIGLTVKF